MEKDIEDLPKKLKKVGNKELISRKEVDGTPFVIVTTEGKSFGVLGKYRITEPRKSKKEVEKELKEITWNRIIQVTMLLIEQLKTK